MPARSLPALRRTSFGCREELATEVRCWGYCQPSHSKDSTTTSSEYSEVSGHAHECVPTLMNGASKKRPEITPASTFCRLRSVPYRHPPTNPASLPDAALCETKTIGGSCHPATAPLESCHPCGYENRNIARECLDPKSQFRIGGIGRDANEEHDNRVFGQSLALVQFQSFSQETVLSSL